MRERNEGWNDDTLDGMRTAGGAGASVASGAEETRSLGGVETRMGTGIEDDGRTDAARRWKAGETILGRYVVEGELGQGGMGVVYACLDKVGGVRVAVKCLPPELSHNSVEMEEARENFQLVYGLSHPNIAAVKQLEQDGHGEYFLVMELAEGEPLRRWMRRKLRSEVPGARSGGGGLPLEEVVPVLRQVASALDYAHSKKVVHRDIKPGNIMIAANGEVKVLDFGLAAQIRTSLSRTSQDSGKTSGTRPYMAPEQWEGRRQDAKTDQYALAAMAYEMLAGCLPFEGDDPAVLREAVLKGEAEEIEGVSAGTMAALRRGLAKGRKERFETCGEFVEALEGENAAKSGDNRFADRNNPAKGEHGREGGRGKNLSASGLWLGRREGGNAEGRGRQEPQKEGEGGKLFLGKPQKDNVPGENVFSSGTPRERDNSDEASADSLPQWKLLLSRITKIEWAVGIGIALVVATALGIASERGCSGLFETALLLPSEDDMNSEILEPDGALEGEQNGGRDDNPENPEEIRAREEMPGKSLIADFPEESSLPEWKIPGAKVTTADGGWTVTFEVPIFDPPAYISKQGMLMIKELVKKLKNLDGGTVLVTGYADNLNADVAMKRAEVAADHLKAFAKNGTLTFRTAVGAEADAPWPNDTPEHRRLNQTVVVKVTPTVN